MSLLHRARLAARRRLGVDLARWPACDPLQPVARQLDHLEVTVVLDVGANDGGYVRDLRALGYRGRVVSFEPTRAAYARLAANTAGDPGWETFPIALGDRDGEAEINVAGNAEASSSLLPMLDRHREARPSAAYTHTETVRLRRLASLWRDHVVPTDRPFLKLDTQGGEWAVLDGADDCLDEVLGMQLELSLVPLYDGQQLFDATVGRLRAAGFELTALLPGFSDPAGRMLQADGVFVRGDQL